MPSICSFFRIYFHKGVQEHKLQGFHRHSPVGQGPPGCRGGAAVAGHGLARGGGACRDGGGGRGLLPGGGGRPGSVPAAVPPYAPAPPGGGHPGLGVGGKRRRPGQRPPCLAGDRLHRPHPPGGDFPPLAAAERGGGRRVSHPAHPRHLDHLHRLRQL